MNFSDNLFPVHDSDRIIGRFSDFFDEKIFGSEPFAISGMSDIRMNLLMTEEYMDAMMPKVRFLEKDPVAPGIYRDGNGNPSKVNRELLLPLSLKESQRKFSWKESQQSVTQDLDAFVSPVSLYRANYYPAAGDLFLWRDLWRQVTVIKINPSDYFQNTGFPLYLHIESSLWVPEFSLDGNISCGPRILSNVEVNKLMPISDTEDGAGPITPSDPREIQMASCDCPIKTPQCYARTCAHYTRLRQ